ncbi:TetR/AcrR family transcriptional regulator [Granulicella sp. S156]|uniref:TetR/AcrR family transcriptional regulator n=1 Tax=Granulicella sp. S156 TaxID=1747224 RepID=UPI00131C97B1|nr:TetR/AcrR family transcriptional regulator [Granulicella sp. S156]
MARPKSSGLPKAEEERLRLTQLLDVAAEVFFEMGYEAASTAEIAARAHSSKRALYSRFASKEELFMAVIDHRTAKIADKVTVLFQEERPIRETLLEVARELLRSLLSEEHTALMRLVYTQALQFPKAAQYMTERGPDRGIVKLAAHLKKQVTRGTLTLNDSQVAAQHFAGLLVGDLVHRAMLGLEIPHSQRQFETRAELAVDAFLKIYGRS